MSGGSVLGQFCYDYNRYLQPSMYYYIAQTISLSY
nr:MAG TPA: hypothetical protein [Caudoviricetes sp.]